MKQKLTYADLRHFEGTETHHPYAAAPRTHYTDGVKYVAEVANAFWLIEEIAVAQNSDELQAEDVQIWTLKVLPDQSAILSCKSENARLLIEKKIDVTDFPLAEMSLYYANDTIFLPVEY